MSHLKQSRRNVILMVLLTIGIIGLTFEVVLFVPRVLEAWHSWDYSKYVEMGQALRQGLNPYGVDHYYPLPTIMWVFVPLSLLPDWFRIVWVLFPFIFVLILFRLQGVLLFLFPPFWFDLSDAMLDGWLLVPLSWLLENRPILAGLGAALLLFKPQLALFAILYMLLQWVKARDLKNLSMFILVATALWLPSFVVDPVWPLKMLASFQIRVDYISILPPLTVSIWSWWELGGLGVVVFLFALLIAIALFWRAMRSNPSRASAIFLFSFLCNPIVQGGNMVTVLPTLRRASHIVIVVLVALGAFVLDQAIGNFGGGYAFGVMTILYFLVPNRQLQTSDEE